MEQFANRRHLHALRPAQRLLPRRQHGQNPVHVIDAPGPCATAHGLQRRPQPGVVRQVFVRAGGLIYAEPLRQHLRGLAADAAADGDADEAARLTSAAGSRGRIPNSASTSTSAGVGAAYINDGGMLGLSFGYLESDYGIPPRADLGEEPTISSRQYRVDLRGELDLGDGLFEKLRIRGAYGDYAHTEFDDGVPGTTFLNKGIEFRTELAQNDRGGWRGASGPSSSKSTPTCR